MVSHKSHVIQCIQNSRNMYTIPRKILEKKQSMNLCIETHAKSEKSTSAIQYYCNDHSISRRSGRTNTRVPVKYQHKRINNTRGYPQLLNVFWIAKLRVHKRDKELNAGHTDIAGSCWHGKEKEVEWEHGTKEYTDDNRTTAGVRTHTAQ